VKLSGALDMASRGTLYPSVILHGASGDDRIAAALDAARTLLCEVEPERRPCGECSHCRRLPGVPSEDEAFHPDLHRLERDRTTVTSVEATKKFLRQAQVAPFEARGQVFVITQAETLSDEAANALLKTLEEPPERSPRHFFLLAPSQFDLLPTLRSRSLDVFLGGSDRPSEDEFESVAGAFADCLAGWKESQDTSYLMAAAAALEAAGDFKDPRADRPWVVAAAAVRSAAANMPAGRRAYYDLAIELLDAPQIRVRGIPAKRILEGLVVRSFAERAQPAKRHK